MPNRAMGSGTLPCTMPSQPVWILAGHKHGGFPPNNSRVVVPSYDHPILGISGFPRATARGHDQTVSRLDTRCQRIRRSGWLEW